ncbi:MAG: TspO/MBR family protein [Patescibacteria group bacterium]|jgi:tryptophan-rich sensory protein
MKTKNFLHLVLAIIAVEAAGILGSFFTAPAITTWYTTLNKPWFQPPNWLFGPVWTILFALMGIAAYLVWQKGWKKKDVKFALKIFAAQMILNVLWSIIFFGLQNPGAAFLEIIALWVSIVATMVVFWKVSRPAVYLLVPYILWVSFAAFLNWTIWIIN